MKNALVSARNSISKYKYKWIYKPVFFKFDPEVIHDRVSGMLDIWGKHSFTRNLAHLFFGFSDPSLEQNVLGVHFKNPVGLSAGFDKDARLISIMPSLGFGFTEVGSVTGEACSGNSKPRLWRLKKSKSLAVYYGLKNEGALSISERLHGKKFPLPVGISIAKTNSKETVETEAGVRDYFKAYQAFGDIGDYVTINISCPNAFGGQPFTDKIKLETLLAKIFSIPKTKPIFLKLSPDLSEKEIDEIIDVAGKFKIDGFVCANLTKNRDNKKIIDENVPGFGGLSGKVVDELSDKLIRYVYKKTNGKYVIIGVGGIFTAEDAYRKIKAGATLLELITGMIYEGPQVISDINLGLVKLLKKDRYKNISEAIGKEIQNNNSFNYKNRKYSVVEYNYKWQGKFDSEAQVIRRIFGNNIRIEHIGSTSVHKMLGKPCIDILIIIKNLEEVKSHIPDLVKAGYSDRGNFVTNDSMLFARINNNTIETNIHFFPEGHKHIAEMLSLRDYLRSHPDEVSQYSELKKTLYEKHPNDYAVYRKKKDEYMELLKRRIGGK